MEVESLRFLLGFFASQIGGLLFFLFIYYFFEGFRVYKDACLELVGFVCLLEF